MVLNACFKNLAMAIHGSVWGPWEEIQKTYISLLKIQYTQYIKMHIGVKLHHYVEATFLHQGRLHFTAIALQCITSHKIVKL